MDETFYLPTLPFWAGGNHWTGSWRGMRFAVTTGEELLAEVWDEDVCRELAQVRAQASFAVTEEGLSALRGWLKEQAALSPSP